MVASAIPSSPRSARYLEHVAERYDLSKRHQFNTRVTGATFDEDTNTWTVTTDAGESVTARYLDQRPSGALSATNTPTFKGMDRVRRRELPHRPVAARGRRLHRQARRRHRHRRERGAGHPADRCRRPSELTVFQRTANYIVPARNGPVPEEVSQARKADYDGIRERIREVVLRLRATTSWRRARWTSTDEELDASSQSAGTRAASASGWAATGHVLRRRGQREGRAEFLTSKIRETVDDPETAEKLIPKGYPFGMQAPAARHRLLRDVQPATTCTWST